MKRYLLHPEVAGGFGPGTEILNRPELEAGNVRVPLVGDLEYEFEGWLGDDLLETFPCFIVSNALGEAIRRSPLTGYSLGPVRVTRSEQFEELYPGRELPPFYRLNVSGGETDDFSMTAKAELIVSEQALALLRENGSLQHCEITELS